MYASGRVRDGCSRLRRRFMWPRGARGRVAEVMPCRMNEAGSSTVNISRTFACNQLVGSWRSMRAAAAIGALVGRYKEKRCIHTTKQSYNIHPHHYSPDTNVRKLEPSFGLLVTDAILNAAISEFDAPELAEKRSELRMSARSRLIGPDDVDHLSYGSILPHLIARALGKDTIEVMERLHSRLSSQPNFFAGIKFDRAQKQLTFIPRFEVAASYACSPRMVSSSINRGFPNQFAIELVRPVNMVQPLRIDSVRPIQMASFLHTLLTSQKHQPMAPLALRVPDLSSMELARLVAFAMTNNKSVTCWDDVLKLQREYSRLSKPDCEPFKKRAISILDSVQRGVACDAVELWRSCEQFSFQNLYEELSYISSDVLATPESQHYHAALTLLELLRAKGIARETVDGDWQIDGSREPVAISRHNVLFRPMFDLAALYSYTQPNNVLFPRRLILVGRTSDNEYAKFLDNALNRLEALSPVAAWTEFTPVASTSFSPFTSATPPPDSALATLSQNVAAVTRRALDSVYAQARAKSPRPLPRIQNKVVENNASSHPTFEHVTAPYVDLLAEKAFRFFSLLSPRQCDLLFQEQDIFSLPRGGALTIYQILYEIDCQYKDLVADANQEDITQHFGLLKSRPEIMRLTKLLVETPDVIRECEDLLNSKAATYHLISLCLIAEKVLLVGRHYKTLPRALKLRLLASTRAASKRLLHVLRCDIDLPQGI